MKMVISPHLLALTPLVLKTYDVSDTKLYVDKKMENHGFYTTVVFRLPGVLLSVSSSLFLGKCRPF